MKLGELALQKYEATLASQDAVPDLELLRAADQDQGFLATYGSIFANLYGLTTCAFLLTAGVAAGMWAH